MLNLYAINLFEPKYTSKQEDNVYISLFDIFTFYLYSTLIMVWLLKKIEENRSPLLLMKSRHSS